MFTIDNKEYDEAKLNDKGKIALAQLQQITLKQQQLSFDFENCKILQQHYATMLREELPAEDKKTEKKK